MAGITDVIDILVLSCNNGGYIEKCIQSIRSNTVGRYNLVVVDQDSKDGSREWLFDNEVVGHRVLCRKNVGVGQGRNRGLSVCKSDWVAMMDSDVEIQDDEWLDKMWNYVIDDHIGLIEAGVRDEAGHRSFGSLSFCMVRKKCLNDIGMFDGRFYIREDIEWFSRFEWSRWKVGFCYMTDVLHYGGRTLNGCLSQKREELIKENEDLLRFKYSSDFLERTLGRYEDRRKEKETQLL